MNNSIRTSEVLNKAADLIEERGWTTASKGWRSGADAPLCLEGGILAAIGSEDFSSDEFLTCPAYAAVKNYLGPRCRNAVIDYDDAELWAWNDTVAKGAPEVIEVLRAAAVIEAAREDAARCAEPNPASRQTSAAPRQRIIPGPVVPAPVEDETSVSA